jgi:inhibitor of cysteine peptidase
MILLKPEESVRRWATALRCVVLTAVLMAAHGVVSAQAGAAGVTVVTEQSGGEVKLKVDAMLETRLEANHTTGYSWIAVPVANPVLARQGAARYEEHAAGGKAGVGGVEVWRFKAMKAGRQGLQFEYRRPWEKGAPAAKIVMFNVTVE